MIRIGDFSKLSQVSIKTLRFYDDRGLLKPVHVDNLNGYRYYDCGQLPRLHRILVLKNLGFSLEEITHLLEENLSAGQLHGMLKMRQAQINRNVHQETERLGQVEKWLRHIEQEDFMSDYDVVIKRINPIKIASIRGIVPTPPEQGGLWNELEGYLAMHHIRGTEACFSLYHDDEHRERDWDIEVCEPISGDLPEEGNVRITTLPSVAEMASTIHAGPFVTLDQAYDAILKWVDENGYLITGPCREVYLKTPKRPGDQNDTGTVTEIQFPVTKV